LSISASACLVSVSTVLGSVFPPAKPFVIKNRKAAEGIAYTAEWRRRKAEEFPADTRNLNAAAELERLAAEIEKLEDSEIHQQICDVQKRINRIDEGDLWMEVSQAESEELRSIGFHVSYDTGLQFLEWYRDMLEEKLQECLEKAVPAPDLGEQVAKDPAVKAAKQIYDEAYAKAYAEVRKRL
jgi:hypothetical protein